MWRCRSCCFPFGSQQAQAALVVDNGSGMARGFATRSVPFECRQALAALIDAAGRPVMPGIMVGMFPLVVVSSQCSKQFGVRTVQMTMESPQLQGVRRCEHAATSPSVSGRWFRQVHRQSRGLRL